METASRAGEVERRDVAVYRIIAAPETAVSKLDVTLHLAAEAVLKEFGYI